MPKKPAPPDAKDVPTVQGVLPWVPPDTPPLRGRLAATNPRAPAASRPSVAPSVGGISSDSALPANGKSVTYAKIVGNNSVVQVVVPENAKPGQNFQANTEHGSVQVKCPRDTWPGQMIPVIVPLWIKPEKTVSAINPVANVPTPTTTGPVSLLQNAHCLLESAELPNLTGLSGASISTFQHPDLGDGPIPLGAPGLDISTVSPTPTSAARGSDMPHDGSLVLANNGQAPAEARASRPSVAVSPLSATRRQELRAGRMAFRAQHVGLDITLCVARVTRFLVEQQANSITVQNTWPGQAFQTTTQETDPTITPAPNVPAVTTTTPILFPTTPGLSLPTTPPTLFPTTPGLLASEELSSHSSLSSPSISLLSQTRRQELRAGRMALRTQHVRLDIMLCVARVKHFLVEQQAANIAAVPTPSHAAAVPISSGVVPMSVIPRSCSQTTPLVADISDSIRSMAVPPVPGPSTTMLVTTGTVNSSPTPQDILLYDWNHPGSQAFVAMINSRKGEYKSKRPNSQARADIITEVMNLILKENRRMFSNPKGRPVWELNQRYMRAKIAKCLLSQKGDLSTDLLTSEPSEAFPLDKVVVVVDSDVVVNDCQHPGTLRCNKLVWRFLKAHQPQSLGDTSRQIMGLIGKVRFIHSIEEGSKKIFQLTRNEYIQKYIESHVQVYMKHFEAQRENFTFTCISVDSVSQDDIILSESVVPNHPGSSVLIKIVEKNYDAFFARKREARPAVIEDLLDGPLQSRLFFQLENGALSQIVDPQEIREAVSTTFYEMKKKRDNHVKAKEIFDRVVGNSDLRAQDVLLSENSQWEDFHPQSRRFGERLNASVGGRPLANDGVMDNTDLANDDNTVRPDKGSISTSTQLKDMVDSLIKEFRSQGSRFFRMAKSKKNSVPTVQEIPEGKLFQCITSRLRAKATLPFVDFGSFPRDQLDKDYIPREELTGFAALRLLHTCREEVYNLKKFIQGRENEKILSLCEDFVAAGHTYRSAASVKRVFFVKTFIDTSTGQKAARYKLPLATWPTIKMLTGADPVFCAYHRGWSEEEDKVLRSLFEALSESNVCLRNVISFFMGNRSPEAVFTRLQREGLCKNAVISSGSLPGLPISLKLLYFAFHSEAWPTFHG
jgi:hypothetical protein